MIVMVLLAVVLHKITISKRANKQTNKPNKENKSKHTQNGEKKANTISISKMKTICEKDTTIFNAIKIKHKKGFITELLIPNLHINQFSNDVVKWTL